MDIEGDGLGPVAISALEHWSYCPRQCGLIHLEQTFDENFYTVRGQLAHQRVDRGVPTTEHGRRIARDVPVWSETIGLVGRVDVLEVVDGVPYPVEYKSGSRRTWAHEAIQLCAQALCLEEMLGCSVPAGAVSYLASKRRREVVFDIPLRKLVQDTAGAVREMLRTDSLPGPVHDRRCRDCSLLDSCLPGVLASTRRLKLLAAELYRANPAEV